MSNWMEPANGNVDASEQQPISADEAVTRAEKDTQAKHRIITVERFLRALLGDKRVEEIGESKPTVSGRSSSKKPLKDAFRTANVYFNHFIKVDSFKVMNQEFLLRAISRGAAIICANNFGSIDIVIPVLFGTILAKEFVSAILVQVKNSGEYSATVRRALFTTINPYACGLFDAKVTNPRPVLRVVFALASEQSAVATPPSRSPRGTGDRFTVYDIWCAGAFHETFDVIHPEEEKIVRTHLLNMRDSHDVFRRTNRTMWSALRQMLPCSSTEEDHYNNWVDVPTDGAGEEVEIADDVDEEAELLPAESQAQAADMK
ncbi:hypothetical protein C8Q80DRAFT_1348147 [Daedaleopsis nitida]|nr:hypothetical protein C8Q80DRAFT_1348147 [Daedaleopsis nitida]